MMFREVPFLQRFEKAKAAGFQGVECLFDWMQHPSDAIAAKLQEHELKLVLFNMPPGDLQVGEIGLAALPGREQDFAASLKLAVEYARVCECERVHVMAGRLPAGDESFTMAHDVAFAANLADAAEAFMVAAGTHVCIEPLNQRSAAGYYLRDTAQARQVIATVSDQLRCREQSAGGVLSSLQVLMHDLCVFVLLN